MAEQTLDANMFTSPYQLTKSMHRDLYPAIEPSNPALSAKGKVIMITGAGGGLGAVSRAPSKYDQSIQAHSTMPGHCKSVGSSRCRWHRSCRAQCRRSRSYCGQHYQHIELSFRHHRTDGCHKRIQRAISLPECQGQVWQSSRPGECCGHNGWGYSWGSPIGVLVGRLCEWLAMTTR